MSSEVFSVIGKVFSYFVEVIVGDFAGKVVGSINGQILL